MKHIIKYENYIKEAHEHGFSILGIFSSIFNKIKLSSLIHRYDDYLYDTYVEYISKVGKVKKDKIKNAEIPVINNDNELLYDKDEIILDNDKDDDSNNIDGTDGGVNINTNTSTNNKKSAKEIIQIIDGDDDEIDNFIELMDDYIADSDVNGLKELRREYNIEYNKNVNLLSIAKKDLSSYNSLKKKSLGEIISHDKKSPEYKKLDDKIKSYDNAILGLTNKIKTIESKVSNFKWFVTETSKVINYLETTIKSTNESKNSRNIGVWKWSHKDIERLTKMINPYQIEEFHLKANAIIENSSNPEKTKRKWDLYLNSLYKKWYATYEINELKNFNKKNIYTPKNKEEKRIKQENIYKSLVIEELYNGSETYIYNFKKLKEDNNNYFILSTNDAFYLIKKISFDNNVYSFQLISSLKSDKSNKETLLISKFMNNDLKNMVLKINDKKIPLYKKENEYPILFINDGIMYGTVDMMNFEKVSLKNNTIYSLKDEHVVKILKASNVSYKNIKVSSEVKDKIKNIKLK